MVVGRKTRSEKAFFSGGVMEVHKTTYSDWFLLGHPNASRSCGAVVPSLVCKICPNFHRLRLDPIPFDEFVHYGSQSDH